MSRSTFLGGLFLLVAAEGCRARPAPAGECGAACQATGACAVSRRWAGDTGARCYPTSSADCRASDACRDEGGCHFAAEVAIDRCVALRPADCLGAAECRTAGRCTLSDDGRCVATEVGCKLSEACATGRACQPRQPRDPRFPPPKLGCADAQVDEALWCDLACRQEGGCRRAGRRCLPASDEDCRRSEGCRAHGRCTRDPQHQVCVAGSAEDCAGSSRCTLGGAASACRLAPGGSFCLDDRAPCVRGRACLALGWCSADEGVCRAFDEARCRASLGCALAGACGLNADRVGCFPESAADCARSQECALFGRCTRAESPHVSAAECVEPGRRPDGAPLRCVASLACERGAVCLRTRDHRCVTREEVAPPVLKPSADPEAAPPPQPRAFPPGPMTATIDGQKSLMTHAVAVTRGGLALRVLLADHPLDCADVAEYGSPQEGAHSDQSERSRGPLDRLGASGGHQLVGSRTEGQRRQRRRGTSVELQLAPVLLEELGGTQPRWRRPAGPAWRVTRASWPGAAGADLAAQVALDEALERGADGRLGLATTMRFRSADLSTLTLAGTMAVKGCGAQPAPGRELARPPRVTLDGAPVAIRGATFRSGLDGPGTWLLTLGDAPSRCRGESDVEVIVRLLPPSGPQQGARWLGVGVAGRRLGREVLQQRLSAQPPTPVRGDDGTVTLDLDLETAGDEAAFLRLKVVGAVTAVDCDAR